MIRLIASSSPKDTERVAFELAKDFCGTETVALLGGLGMGKTAFTRGIAKGLGIDPNEVSSPTFAIVHEHNSPEGKKLCHYDMYRIDSWEDLESTGFFESVGRCVNVVEWSENIENALPFPRWQIEIALGEAEDQRIIVVEYLEGE